MKLYPMQVLFNNLSEESLENHPMKMYLLSKQMYFIYNFYILSVFYDHLRSGQYFETSVLWFIF